jgi:hypothetical protein
MLYATADFWKVIGTLGWGTSSNYEAMKVTLMLNGRDWCLDFSTTYRRVLGALRSNAAEAGFGFCYDSWDDVLAHTVGLGKATYDACMADPRALINRMEAGDYSESFTYAVPDEYDFLQLGREALEARLEKCKAEYLAADETEMIDALCHTSLQGLNDKASELRDKAVAVVERNGRAGYRQSLTAANHKWCLWNLLSDVAVSIEAGIL